MSKKPLQESSWGVPIAVDWEKDEKPPQTANESVDISHPRPASETVVIGLHGETIIADRVTRQNHI